MTMKSPTRALLSEIWWQHRSTVAAIAGLTVIGRLIDFLEAGGGTGDAGSDASPLTTMLAMLTFLLLFGVFNYTESGDSKAVGQFPRRLFTLPVTSLRLVAVPVLAGIAAIELLYLLWLQPLSRDGSLTPPFVAILLAVCVVFYLCTLWTLERSGSLRLVILGVLAIAVFVFGMLPSFPPAPPPAWRSEMVLAGFAAGLAIVAFVTAWRHVARLRTGAARTVGREASFFGWMAEASTTRRSAFTNPAAAYFWFEWRSSGVVLPALVGGVMLVAVMPMSWLVRGDAGDTFRLLLAALAAPVVLAIPVGIGFSKPMFWSEDLAIPAFLAIRPVSSEDFVAIKVKVAALSAVLSWLIVFVFLAIWLPSWATLDTLSLLAIQLWAFHGQSLAAVFGIAVLVACAGMFLTWRFLVSRLWSGLSGIRRLFVGSVLAIVILVIFGFASDADRLPGWLLDDPARLAPLAWTAAVAVVAKYWIAAYVWRSVPAHYFRAYFLIWLAGTAAFLALGMVFWRMARIYLPVDAERLQSVIMLLALLAVPLARVGLAPSLLARNRHQ